MRGKLNYFKIVIAVLLISLSANVYLSINHYIYKQKASKNTYSYMRGVKEKVNLNLEAVNVILDNKSYSGNEILSIYDNFSGINNKLIELWDDYNFYSDTIIINKDRIDTGNVLENDVFSRIDEYMRNMLNNIMVNNKHTSYKLTAKERKDFDKINELLSDISNMFNEYDKNELKGLENGARENAVMKNDYWIDMLDKINNISRKFSDYNFSNENKQNNSI